MSSEGTSTCEDCGASVYKEHLDAGIARYEEGRLLCKHCVEEYKKSHDAAASSADADFEPIQFDDEDTLEKPVDLSESRIHTGASDSLVQKALWDENRFKRIADPKAIGASRVRIFHAKLSEGALEYMNNQINEWLDEHDDIVVKFSTSTVGTLEGKHPEPNLFMALFY